MPPDGGIRQIIVLICIQCNFNYDSLISLGYILTLPFKLSIMKFILIIVTIYAVSA